VFGQTYSPPDLGVIALLVLLEGVLSIDNALVLALLAKPLPKEMRARALTYGLVGAFLFRFVAIGLANYLLQWRIVKLIGGGYLLWIAVQYFITSRKKDPSKPAVPPKIHGFWTTVALIEVTDIAFAIDSILAAIALVGSAPEGTVGPHPKLWVVITGGMLGVMLMRIAATVFISLLERFPRFETSAYLLVMVIGLKLLIEWGANTDAHPHLANFHQPSSPLFWAFWSLMAICVAFGFLPQKQERS
jgi:YkoY family integral membrane protein